MGQTIRTALEHITHVNHTPDYEALINNHCQLLSSIFNKNTNKMIAMWHFIKAASIFDLVYQCFTFEKPRQPINRWYKYAK